jgi:tRNA pseudouridine32 synthase/23S rRNA pseudouridine746 synthase
VVDKPSGLLSVPGRSPTLVDSALTRVQAQWPGAFATHRLDLDTSGLLVLARTRSARSALGRAFEMRAVAKRYLAVVIGRPSDASGEICLPLAADRDRPPRQRVDPAVGKPATTRWRFLATAAQFAEMPATSLVEVEPLTGRSHQIRVHLAELGCPIAGDRLYGGTAADVPLALHAAHLDLPHPATGERLVLAALPPAAAPRSR